MYRLILLIFTFTLTHSLIAQKQFNNWVLGNKSGISFSTGSPVSFNGTQMNQFECVGSMSDNYGNLLFYTNGVEVWNRLNAFMQNGTGLNGNYSTTQVLIIPQPGNDSIYFIITADEQARSKGLCYSIVNMNHDNGLGVVTAKNIQLITPVCEKISAVRHCNNRDIWITARGWNSTNYYTWLVTANGVTASPVISPTPNFLTDPWDNNGGTLGYMKFSPDGKKIAATMHMPESFTEVSEFNSATGIISNTIKIIDPIPGLFNPKPDLFFSQNYGIEFSPNSSKLYVSTIRTSMQWLSPLRDYEITSLVQYDVSIHDSLQIFQSMKIIDTINSFYYAPHWALQLGPDNKIYVAEEAVPFLSSIEAPNNPGLACDFQRGKVPLVNLGYGGLPSFNQSYFGNNTHNYTFSNSCASQSVSFQINSTQGYSSIRWNFDDPSTGANNTSVLPNPTHNFSTSGIYNVMLIVNRNSNPCAIPDTIKKQIWVGQVTNFLSADTTICEKDTLTLTTPSLPNMNYLWSTGSASNTIRITNTGDYWLRITAGNCVYSDTIKISQQLLPRFSLGNNIAICSTSSVVLQPTVPAPLGSVYIWNTNATTPSITISQSGNYWLEVTDLKKCTWRDTITVTTKPLPTFSLGNDTSFCEQSNLGISIAIANAGYLWSSGSTLSSITVDTPGQYWGEAIKDGCKFRDTINVTLKPLPIVNLGSDTIICEGVKLLLSAFNTNATYLWQNRSIEPTYEVVNAGSYSVRVALNGCSKADTINIDYKLKPRFTLGNDITICPGQLIVLQPTPNPVTWNYSWQNGVSSPTFPVDQGGLYVLAVTNECGTAQDSIFVKSGTCKIYLPNVFTPNNDGINDVFKALNLEAVTEMKLLIYDRWGNKVFETTDKNKGWDGSYNGKPVPSGFFSYVFYYKGNSDSNMIIIKGLIQVLR